MTTSTVQRPPDLAPATAPPRPASRLRRWLRTPRWHRFTSLQILTLVAATIPPVVIAATVAAAAIGLISTEIMVEVSLAAGEDPGLLVFGAMFLATPVQHLTGRSQVRVRKILGILFFTLAASNGAMFLVERALADAVSEPFLLAGTLALVVAVPLFLTSSQWSQRALGMKRWRALHKLTYLVAVALVAHVVLTGEFAVEALLIILGFVGRVPIVRRWLASRIPSM